MLKHDRSSNSLGQATKQPRGLRLLAVIAWFGLAGCGDAGNSVSKGSGGRTDQGGQTGSGGQETGGQTGQGGAGTGGRSTVVSTGGTCGRVVS
jgi:hypothetical protein